MKKIFKIILIFTLLFSFFGLADARVIEIKFGESNWRSHSNQELKNKMTDSITWDNEKIVSDTNIWWVFKTFKENILSLVYIIVIWAIIWIWIRMASARWNPDEFKKAWIHFVYLLVWIFFIFAAVWIVKLIYSLNLFS